MNDTRRSALGKSRARANRAALFAVLCAGSVLCTAVYTWNTLTVVNSSRVVGVVNRSPAARTKDLVTGTCRRHADDGDQVTCRFERALRPAGAHTRSRINGETQPTLDLIKPGDGDKGDHISLSVWATESNNRPSARPTSVNARVSPPPPTIATLQLPTTDKATDKTRDRIGPTVTAGDHDGDRATYSYVWRHYASARAAVAKAGSCARRPGAFCRRDKSAGRVAVHAEQHAFEIPSSRTAALHAFEAIIPSLTTARNNAIQNLMPHR